MYLSKYRSQFTKGIGTITAAHAHKIMPQKHDFVKEPQNALNNIISILKKEYTHTKYIKKKLKLKKKKKKPIYGLQFKLSQ